jgi:hypothetical protein
MGRDYAEAMVEQGAANGLEISEDPIELYLKNESVEKEHSRMYFYAPFEPSKFLVQ